MLRLILARHGQTEENVRQLIQGQMNVPLDEQGREQAHQLAHRLSGEPLTAIYSSPLKRAWETAQCVASQHALPVTSDARLMEANYGIWQGLSWKEVRARHRLPFAEWSLDRDRVPEGAETLTQVKDRIMDFLGELRRRFQKQEAAVLVVSHGGPIRALLSLGFGIDLMLGFNLQVDNASLSELSFSEARAVLRYLNDTCHLRDAGS